MYSLHRQAEAHKKTNISFLNSASKSVFQLVFLITFKLSKISFFRHFSLLDPEIKL